MSTRRGSDGRRRATAVVALGVSLAGLATFGSVVAGAGEWVEGRDLEVVLPWALPALLVSALAATACLAALRVPRAVVLAVPGAVVVALALAALVLVNPAISHPVP